MADIYVGNIEPLKIHKYFNGTVKKINNFAVVLCEKLL